MTEPILVAVIAGVCSIVSAAIAALITKYGLPFWRGSTVIRTKGSAHEHLVILPDGRITESEGGDSYDISNGALRIRRDKVSLSAILNAKKATGEIVAADATLTGDGVFVNGVAYITYHVRDSRNTQEWFGLLLLRVPGLGDISGYWIAEDHIKAGHIAMGSIRMART